MGVEGFFLGIQNKLEFLVVPMYSGHAVLRIKYNQTCFTVVLIFNTLLCICFIKPAIESFLEIFKAQKFGTGFFGGLIFGPRIFWGFDFCPHLIIPVS